MLVTIPEEIIGDNVSKFSERLVSLDPLGKQVLLALMRLRCDKCATRLSLPFRLYMFLPDSTEEVHQDMLALNHEGVHVYLHEKCSAELPNDGDLEDSSN